MTILVLLPWGLQQGAGLVGAGTKLLTNERSASTEVFKIILLICTLLIK